MSFKKGHIVEDKSGNVYYVDIVHKFEVGVIEGLPEIVINKSKNPVVIRLHAHQMKKSELKIIEKNYKPAVRVFTTP